MRYANVDGKRVLLLGDGWDHYLRLGDVRPFLPPWTEEWKVASRAAMEEALATLRDDGPACQRWFEMNAVRWEAAYQRYGVAMANSC